MAGGDVFAEAGVPAIGVSCTNPNVTLLCDYYWRICFLDPFQGTVMANFAKELGATKAYVLTMLGEDYGVGLGKYFVEAFKGLGGEVADQATFPEGSSDFTAYINNATNAGCDVMFAPCSTTYAALIIDQAATGQRCGSRGRRKGVCLVNGSGEIMEAWPSVQAASKATGISRETIRKHCNGGSVWLLSNGGRFCWDVERGLYGST
jgi:hypothetical protein